MARKDALNVLKKNRKPRKDRQDENNNLPPNYIKQVKKLIAIGLSVIHDEKNKIEENQLPRAFKRAQRTAQYENDAGPKAIADVAFELLAQIERMVKKKGANVRPLVVVGAIGPIVAEIADVMKAAGIYEPSEEDIQVAIAAAINRYASRALKQGKISKEQLKEAAEALQRKFPKQAENFTKMIKNRHARQKDQKRVSDGAPVMPRQEQQGGQNMQGGQNTQGEPGLLRR